MIPRAPEQVLFLCTGNYYRSRFAEEMFNHRAPALGLNWHATSRALAIERGRENVGAMSRYTREALHARGIAPLADSRLPLPLTTADLEAAALVVAVKEAEHRALLRERHPGWEDRVTYWHIHDIDAGTPQEAIEALAAEVEALMAGLR